MECHKGFFRGSGGFGWLSCLASVFWGDWIHWIRHRTRWNEWIRGMSRWVSGAPESAVFFTEGKGQSYT